MNLDQSMSICKKFAVAGVGNVGKFIAEELVSQLVAGRADEVTLLTREVTIFFSRYCIVETMTYRGLTIR